MWGGGGADGGAFNHGGANPLAGAFAGHGSPAAGGGANTGGGIWDSPAGAGAGGGGGGGGGGGANPFAGHGSGQPGPSIGGAFSSQQGGGGGGDPVKPGGDHHHHHHHGHGHGHHGHGHHGHGHHGHSHGHGHQGSSDGMSPTLALPGGDAHDPKLDDDGAGGGAHSQAQQNPLLSPPGLPYSAADLQRQFVGMSARDVYALLCRRNNCRVISSVIDQLPEKPGVWELQTLDLEKTYVGHRGVLPVLELCKLLHKLQTLVLANNYLSNKAVWHACQMLTFHPTVQSVSFANNDVSWTASMSVLELVTRNSNIRAVDVNETLFQPKVTQAILTQVRRNVSGASGKEQRKRGQTSSNPIGHARAVRIRALKRLFRDLLSKKGSEGKVPRECIEEGVRALATLSGREREIEQRGADFLRAIAARAPSDEVDWEAFLLIVLFPEVPYRQEHVDALRRLFNSVNSDGSGYIFVSELPAMLAAVLGHPPTQEEIHTKFAYYGLSPDDTVSTCTWDEFLVLVSEHGPEIGEHVSHQTKTPIARQGGGGGGVKPPHH